MTLTEAKQMVKNAGFEVLDGASWEDERTIYASSVKTVPGTFGHPAFEVQYQKETGWMSVTDQKPRRIVACHECKGQMFQSGKTGLWHCGTLGCNNLAGTLVA